MTWRPGHRSQRAFSAIEVLLVLAVILIAAAWFVPRTLGGTQKQVGASRALVADAKDTVCQANLSQVRQTLNIRRMAGSAPRSLAELGLPDSETRCVVGGEAYIYTPETGRITCPHPGHDTF